MSPCTGTGVNFNYERIASRVSARFRTRASESQNHLPPSTVTSNVLAMTRPSKTDWHQLKGITHRTQQRLDSEQERFSNPFSEYMYICMLVLLGSNDIFEVPIDNPHWFK